MTKDELVRTVEGFGLNPGVLPVFGIDPNEQCMLYICEDGAVNIMRLRSGLNIRDLTSVICEESSGTDNRPDKKVCLNFDGGRSIILWNNTDVFELRVSGRLLSPENSMLYLRELNGPPKDMTADEIIVIYERCAEAAGVNCPWPGFDEDGYFLLDGNVTPYREEDFLSVTFTRSKASRLFNTVTLCLDDGDMLLIGYPFGVSLFTSDRSANARFRRLTGWKSIFSFLKMKRSAVDGQ